MSDIDREIDDLKERLMLLREEMPETPLDAEKKAMEVGILEEQLAELYERKGTASIPSTTGDERTEEIKSITDELMEIEVRMIQAEMAGNDDERVKLQMCANTLKARRQSLIDEVRESNVSKKGQRDDLEERISRLEKEVADIKTLLYQILTKE